MVNHHRTMLAKHIQVYRIMKDGKLLFTPILDMFEDDGDTEEIDSSDILSTIFYRNDRLLCLWLGPMLKTMFKNYITLDYLCSILRKTGSVHLFSHNYEFFQ